VVNAFDPYIGHLAGIATAALWTGTSIFFTGAGKRIGPTAVNAFRIGFAVMLLAGTHRYLAGQWVPDLVGRQVVFLALSGIVGLSIGDQALLTAFVDIGPRLTTLIMTTSPLFAALLGRIVLGETLAWYACIGIAMTVAGVGGSVLERSPQSNRPRPDHMLRGVLLALVGAACQAGGLLLSKQGMGHGWLPANRHLDPQAATLVRMVFAAAGMLPIVGLHAYRMRVRGRSAAAAARRIGSVRAGYALAACGAIVGPYLGVWMSLVAGDRAPIGIAQALCSLTPLFVIPAVAILYKERISGRAVFGAVVAVVGSAILFIPE